MTYGVAGNQRHPGTISGRLQNNLLLTLQRWKRRERSLARPGYYARDAYAAAENADALIILTEWKEFADLDLKRCADCWRFPWCWMEEIYIPLKR